VINVNYPESTNIEVQHVNSLISHTDKVHGAHSTCFYHTIDMY